MKIYHNVIAIVKDKNWSKGAHLRELPNALEVASHPKNIMD